MGKLLTKPLNVDEFYTRKREKEKKKLTNTLHYAAQREYVPMK